MIFNIVLGSMYAGYMVCSFNPCQNIISILNGWNNEEIK
jgi:hypothetical protein